MGRFAIVHGWAEGPWQSKPMVRLLRELGWQQVRNPRQADVVIAHSSGCYLLSRKLSGKRIILIGPPLWPGRTLPESILRKLKEDLANSYSGRYGGWLLKIAHNWWYIISRPLASWHAATRMRTEALPAIAGDNRVIIVRNRDDTFCHADIAKLAPGLADCVFLSMSGGHDDCWTRPERYLGLVTGEV